MALVAGIPVALCLSVVCCGTSSLPADILEDDWRWMYGCGVPVSYTHLGKDTVDFSLADADYKVVTYIDSGGCTSCKLQLPRWKLFMQEVDSTLNRPVPFVSVSYTHLDVRRHNQHGE